MVGAGAFALLIGLVDIFIAEQFAEDAWCKANIGNSDKAYDFLGLLWPVTNGLSLLQQD